MRKVEVETGGRLGRLFSMLRHGYLVMCRSSVTLADPIRYPESFHSLTKWKPSSRQ
jgi:hypothetical protein